MLHTVSQVADHEWVAFPGGELEGRRPRALCPSCRAQLARAGSGEGPRPRPRTLCFQCYRTNLDRERALRAAGRLDTASEARFQSALPFEPVNRLRLQMLKAERAAARTSGGGRLAQCADRRRAAQMAARRALQAIAAGVEARRLASAERERVLAEALHAAELQLPDAWLPYVVSR